MIISLYLALIVGFPVYWRALSVFPTFRLCSNYVSYYEKWTWNESADPAEATFVLTDECCLRVLDDLIYFSHMKEATRHNWSDQTSALCSNYLPFSSYCKKHNCFLSGTKTAHLYFYSILKDDFSLPVTCNLFVADQYIGCWLFKAFREVCVFLGIKGEEILDLGVIVISRDTIWRDNLEQKLLQFFFNVVVIVRPQAAFSWQFGVLSAGPENPIWGLVRYQNVSITLKE